MIRSGLILLALALSLSACRDFSVTPDGDPSNRDAEPHEFTVTTSDPFELKLGDTAFLEGTELSMTFSNLLMESRCPANVVCIQAGEAEILLEVAVGNSGSFQVVANIPGLVPTPHRFNNIIQFEGLRFQLLQLTPYPVDGGQAPNSQEYSALISLTPAF